jgi:pyruvate formate lyase activating enzyme
MKPAAEPLVCPVCFHACRLQEGQTGFCRGRKNVEGRIIDINYGQISSLALDPIEKKPLRMFCPGSRILSIGSFGCNLRCPFCQNHPISMKGEGELPLERMSPEEIIRYALSLKGRGNIGIAFTYNEPLIGWEFVRDTARLAKAAGLKTVLVTNGTARLRILEQIIRYIDAMNIDIKGFTEEYYRSLGGNLREVMDFSERAVRSSHVEFTNLIVPGMNDSDEEMLALSDWISWMGYGIPLHVTRYFPRYQMDTPATDRDRIYHLADVARRHLKNVFIGNC